MTRPLHLAHQLGTDWHDWLRSRLPVSARLDRLERHDPWNVKPGVNVLLVGNGVLRHLSRRAPSWAPGLEWVHTRPTGLDDAPDWLFDVPCLTVSRGASAPAIAEYAIAAMLDVAKGFTDLRVRNRDGWRKPNPCGLDGNSLGLVGFGEIGRAIAARARAFGMVVRATRRSSAHDVEGVSFHSLYELCALSDHLVLCAPLTDATRGMLDAAAFSRCRLGQHLVNIARGGLIVPDALLAALDGPIARATLDVWTEEPPPADHWVYSHPRVFLTPHCASLAPSTEARVQEILDSNLAAWLDGRPNIMIGHVNRGARY